MTDNEIVKALRCCADRYCKGCSEQSKAHCRETIAALAWDLIYRQNAEIERLTKEKDALIKTYGECMSDGIKEFAEKLTEEQYFYEDDCGDFVGFVPVAKIDELVKEMLEGKK